MQLYTVYLYLETALHVSVVTSTHRQERIQLHLQHLVFVTLLLLPATIAAGSSNSVISSYPEPARSSPHPTSHFLKLHLNIILSSTPGSPNWPLSFRFPHQNPVHIRLSSIRATCPVHLINLLV